MDYRVEKHVDSSQTAVWEVLKSEKFLKKLINKLSPIELGLPSSFYNGDQYSGVIEVRGKDYDYTAKLTKINEQKKLEIDVFTESVDGKVTIQVKQADENTALVTMDIDIFASGLVQLFVGSARGILDGKVHEALRMLESEV